MQSSKKQSLRGKQFCFVGHCSFDHPTKQNFFVQISIYQYSLHQFLVCMSEGRGKLNVNNNSLGKRIDGVYLIPYAKRVIKNVNFNDLKDALEKSKPVKWFWKNKL